ncbi:hypothetical protein TNCV_2409261 [Trichonephila clavipes]|nr:hypothetical protein TNCV_2409261 [Trichonephila clavipes]
MWHKGLIYTMIHLKFPDYVIILINSYLENRTFQVKIEATNPELPISRQARRRGQISITSIRTTSPPFHWLKSVCSLMMQLLSCKPILLKTSERDSKPTFTD